MPLSRSPAIVLDTNVVLDWLVFGDPSCSALAAAITNRRIRWLADAGMREEFDQVLQRGVGSSCDPDLGLIGQTWRIYAQMHDRRQTVDPALLTRNRCRCADPDDQPFIDLALLCGARWLLSRDRAVLHLAREAMLGGLQISTPLNWSERE